MVSGLSVDELIAFNKAFERIATDQGEPRVVFIAGQLRGGSDVMDGMSVAEIIALSDRYPVIPDTIR